MITPDLLRRSRLFANYPERELTTLASRSADMRIRPNEWLLHEGEWPSFYVLIDGELEVRKVVGGIDRPLTRYSAGEYFGEVPLMLASPAVASVRAITASRVARIDPDDFRELVTECPTFNAEMMRTMTTRLGRLQQVATTTPRETVKLIGHRFDLACHELRDFLARNRIPYRWLDPVRRETNVEEVPAPKEGDRYPKVVLPDGSELVTPTFRELAERVGLQTRPAPITYDVAIIGGGPAGLAAAVYGASEGLKTLLVERAAPGGQASTSSRIENYLGFPTGVSGDELGARALTQARRFGAEILVARRAISIEPGDNCGVHSIALDGEERVAVRTIVLATGVQWRELEVPGCEDLVGRGVYYGASRTEAQNTLGQNIFLIGGGNSAGQAAMFFADYAQSVTLLVRGPSLAQSMSRYLIDQLATKDNIRVLTRQLVVAASGDGHLESIDIEDRTTGERRTEPADGLFVFIGADTETAWLPPALIRDERGYVCTGRDVMDLVANGNSGWVLERDPFLLETSVPGIFAAGDVRHGSIKRVASGVGEGSMAIAFVHQYLAQTAPTAAPATAMNRPGATTIGAKPVSTPG